MRAEPPAPEGTAPFTSSVADEIEVSGPWLAGAFQHHERVELDKQTGDPRRWRHARPLDDRRRVLSVVPLSMNRTDEQLVSAAIGDKLTFRGQVREELGWPDHNYAGSLTD